ncbi:helix-turn-helix domain-containing protein [Yersinia aleksiciae]|uniref:DNA-binding protein n=1 Tax=Yersinia aleksiciae TaxID=263819 RepID=A0A0T9TGL7_YERAE|nr:helix-turn-helix domain-containing protein [Yersinia aleksiciae]AKP32198.1 DNA-binding protein [Yersinia aleksiciae]MDA5496731.1 helix-turn-helix domain-containing protein [Yersinia aleksiciae]MDN0124133.1 helix-turn-helix domain-containing protein [Yersinia aleksiciae]NIL00735.1 helix-turn-helix domain-containing protein [Yersinia aleksiciae]WQC72213.1 helix-turn-helix domain-containing protein [Yersinia aleksiciae]
MNLYRIRELRQARAWSQEQLAELCSLNVRTIQRIENGEHASLETLSAIAAVLDLKVSELYTPGASQQQAAPADAVDQRVLDARDAVDNEMAFLRQLLRAVILCAVLFAINWFTSPSYMWAWWVVLGLGIPLGLRAINTFLLGNWVERWQQKRLQKKLRNL